MSRLLVCINNNSYDLHFPVIQYLNYDVTDSDALVERAGQNLKDCYDEVYLVDFDDGHNDFIEEIRKHGRKL